VVKKKLTLYRYITNIVLFIIETIGFENMINTKSAILMLDENGNVIEQITTKELKEKHANETYNELFG
jgi:hypothetical protein